MAQILILRNTLSNLDVLVEEISTALIPVYGEQGASLYAAQAPAVFDLYRAGGERRFWGLMTEEVCEAAVLTCINRGRGEVTLVHATAGTGKEVQLRLLLEQALADLKARGATSILAEYLPTSPYPAAESFASSGFDRIPRVLLESPLDDDYTPLEDNCCIGPANLHLAARCLVDAYHDTPGARLHREVSGLDHATHFIQRVLAGEFGVTTPLMNPCLTEKSHAKGVALGCILAPGIGFTLQLATAPRDRKVGVARSLLLAQQAAFREAGCIKASLAVTRENLPAMRLYTSLNYRPVLEFDAHVWHR